MLNYVKTGRVLKKTKRKGKKEASDLGEWNFQTFPFVLKRLSRCKQQEDNRYTFPKQLAGNKENKVFFVFIRALSCDLLSSVYKNKVTGFPGDADSAIGCLIGYLCKTIQTKME